MNAVSPLSPRRVVARPASGRGGSGAAARGLTLLELLLALALSTLVFAAISMAIDLHLRTIETGRTEIEQSQLARAVLRRMADDLRGAVQYQVIDFSSLQSITSGAAVDLGNLQSEDDLVGTGLDPNGGSANGGGSNNGNPNAPGSASNGGQSGTGGQGGMGGSGGGMSFGGGSGSGGLDPTGLDPLAMDDASAGDSSQNIAQTSTPAVIPGIYGNQYELQIDVSRLPRPDEYSGVHALGVGASPVTLPSDIKTVSYFLRPPETVTDNTYGMTRGGFSDEAQLGGLVRREVDRAAGRLASDTGDTQLLDDAGDVIAPEVTGLEFRYFDGSQWLTEWDSGMMESLPVAIEIALAVTPQRFVQTDEDSPFARSGEELFRGEIVYRMVVRLPAAKPAPPLETEEPAL